MLKQHNVETEHKQVMSSHNNTTAKGNRARVQNMTSNTNIDPLCQDITSKERIHLHLELQILDVCLTCSEHTTVGQWGAGRPPIRVGLSIPGKPHIHVSLGKTALCLSH